PSCEEGGVLGVLPGIVGSLQAAEAIKIVLGTGAPLVGRLLLLDVLGMRFRELALDKDPDCPLCGTHPTIRQLIDYDAFCNVTTKKRESVPMELTTRELQARLAQGDPVTVVDVREAWEW